MTDFENHRTDDGAELGRNLARLCESAIGDGKDTRCRTCAGRAGDHLANGSPWTLMNFVKAAAERTPFMCHEDHRPCAA